jgi:hypothetical protein
VVTATAVTTLIETQEVVTGEPQPFDTTHQYAVLVLILVMFKQEEMAPVIFVLGLLQVGADCH